MTRLPTPRRALLAALALCGGAAFAAGSHHGSHGEHALEAPATTWYFAEGATHSGFDLFYLLYNPSTTTPAQVQSECEME